MLLFSVHTKIAGVYDLLLNLLKEISYVSTRSEQIANANLSMSEAFSRLVKDKYSDYFYKHKDNPPHPEGKLSFNVFL